MHCDTFLWEFVAQLFIFEETVAFILAPGSDSEMSDLEDGNDKSNNETPQEADNDFDDADFGYSRNHQSQRINQQR